MKVSELETFVDAILTTNEPGDVILAVRNELNHNEKHLGIAGDDEMKRLINLLEDAAVQAKFILHGE